MNVRRLILCLCLLPGLSTAQGFAGLGSQTEGFAVPQRGHTLQFPRDHGPHPDFRIEWWYVTANLKDAEGSDYGVQWTLFRSALNADDPAEQVWMGNAALTTADTHLTSERFGRSDLGQAGVGLPMDAHIDEWQLFGDPETRMHMQAGGTGFFYDLKLTATGPLVLHGDGGYSEKSAGGQASYYYSQPHLTVDGTVETAEGPVTVTGQAWLDREWSSQPLAADQDGWDWFSLSFDSGDKLMGFRLRGSQIFTSGTWIGADGSVVPLPPGAFTANATDGAAGDTGAPTNWTVSLPNFGVDVTVTAINPNASMPMLFPYWEGPVRIEGSHGGLGYLELTGYD